MGGRLSKVPRRLWLPIVLVAIGIAPFVSVIVAGSIATLNGCALSEGDVFPCIVFGIDIGKPLAMMGVLGWFMLATIYPLAVGVLWLVVEGVVLIVRKIRRR